MATKEHQYGIDKVLALFDAEGVPMIWPVSVKTMRKWRREDPLTALQRLIAKAGSQSALAKSMGVTQKTISTWLRGDIPERAPKVPANEVERAVAIAGDQPTMAAELGVTQQCVSRWCRTGFVPSNRAKEIEMLTGVPRAGLLNPKLRNALGTGGDL